MTFETETHLTLAEYKALSRKLLFKKRGTWVLLIAALVSTAMLVLNLVGLIERLDNTYQTIFLFFFAIGVAVLFVAFGTAEKHYNSNKLVSEPRLYIFDDEKVSYTLPGAGGNMAWAYITRYDQVDKCLMLYTSGNYALIVKTDTLNAQQINFIKSKIKMPERLGQVKLIR